MWERAIFFFAIHIFTTRCCQIWHTGRKTTDSLNLLQSVDGTWKEKRVTTSPLKLKEASRSQCHLLAVVRTLRTRNTAKNFRFTWFQFLSNVFLHVFLSSVHLRDTRLTLNITARVWVYFCNSNQTVQIIRHQLDFRCLIVFFIFRMYRLYGLKYLLPLFICCFTCL